MKQAITNFLLLETGKRIKNNSGFSLLEILIAVDIIGIIPAIAILQFADQRANTTENQSNCFCLICLKLFF